jgi:hypothetical protein
MQYELHIYSILSTKQLVFSIIDMYYIRRRTLDQYEVLATQYLWDFVLLSGAYTEYCIILRGTLHSTEQPDSTIRNEGCRNSSQRQLSVRLQPSGLVIQPK